MDRNQGFRRRQHRARIEQQLHERSAMEFFNVLTGEELLERTEEHLPEHRERLYPPTVTLAMFLRQALSADGSCQRVVNAWAASRAAEGLRPQSVRTGGYCRARARLPATMVQALTLESGRLLSERAASSWRWRGRRVKLLDGTGISMPDTAANQAAYPQPSTQAPGVGFPLARLSALICLASGAVLGAAAGPHRGAGCSELDLSRTLLGALERGDLLVADALYAHYFLVAQLAAAGVDVCLEQHGARHSDFRRGERLGPRDHRVCWPKPDRPPGWMSAEAYAAAPAELRLREVRVGRRVLVTTLLDAREVSKAALNELYTRRWNIELDLRSIKTTLGMEVLRCLTPAMIEKELWVHLLAYNLIRVLMAQAAAQGGCEPRQISFKHTVQLWSEWSTHLLGRDTAVDLALLWRWLAQPRVGHRPGRVEPRARKRRPKSYPWLKVPRREARTRIRTYAPAQNVK